MAAQPSLSEAEVCDQLISPALAAAGWSLTQVRREVTFTDGRVTVRGNVASRGPKKRADYVLELQPNLPLAVIEAKAASQSVGAGMQQALVYAEMLDIPFVLSSNGSGFVLHDRTGMSEEIEVTIPLAEMPSPGELWGRYYSWKYLASSSEKVVRFPFYEDSSGKEPRYYQRIAVQRAVEAIAKSERRVLLVMATGTGKTYTAFQIIWRLWKAGVAKRILFLADRNILLDQTKTNDFKPFGAKMTKVQNREIDKAYEVYLALYQAVSGTEEASNVYKQFSRDFFDLIVVDECHRGSAKVDSAWREILDYFDAAVHLGLTATPKETNEVSTLSYFGEPVYTYSLKQGIEDGFLAPYKVVRIDLDKDVQGWRPEQGMVDDGGQEIEDRTYNTKDMDRVLVLNQRTKRVAERFMDHLLRLDPYAKSIVFCEDVDHAERMRQEIVNIVAKRLPKELDNRRYVMRITGDNPEGKAELDQFIHPEERYPVIATTSKLLTTGVDAKTCKFIVIDQTITSTAEFKQIIGRGTRIHEDAGKLWFTIIDFRKATELFADPAFDGLPIKGDGGGSKSGDDDEEEEESDDEILEDPPPDGPAEPEPPGPDGPEDPPPEPRKRYVVSGVTVSVLSERVQYMDGSGKLVTVSLKDYTKTTVHAQYASLDAFLTRWTQAERKQALIDEMAEQGLLIEALQDELGKGFDPFDLVCHVAFDRPPLTRRERAENVRKRDVFAKYGAEARAVLDALLEKYADQGVGPLENTETLRVAPLSALGTPIELVKRFGGRDGYLSAVRELESELYRQAG